LLIAVAAGVAFFAAEHRWYYQPDLANPDFTLDIFSTEQMKARAAIRRVLLNPYSAQFSALRSVEMDEARFVCGAVKARDKDGQLAMAAFVYTVAIDFARIDDHGRITHQQATFKPCPVTEEETFAQQKSPVLPGALSIAKSFQKGAPKVDPSGVSTLTRLAGGAGETSEGTMEQPLGELVGKSASAYGAVGGKKTDPAVEASLGNELDWRADHQPVAWPIFPLDHTLAKSTRKRTVAEALALAKEVEERWEQAKSPASSKVRPSSEEIKEACRALMTIDPRDKDYPKAWAAFVRLRKIDRALAG
jgi:hypothetical protein